MPGRLAALLLVIASVSGCATVSKINIYTEPQEMAVGEIFNSQIEAYYPVLGDPRVSWYMNHKGRVIADLSERRDLPYSFGVVDTPELNAFAIPGGHIYFNLGMIEAADSESELIGVMAHEIGHIIAQHSMRQLSTQSLVNILGTIALNQYPNQWAALAANLFVPTSFLKMSRDAEREADQIGFDLMVRAGYHPSGMVDVFRKFLRLRDEAPRLLDKLFLTHPPSQERIDNIESMIASTELPSDLKRDSEEFQLIRQYVRDTYYTESHRRSWAEFLRQKDKGEDGERREDDDRLPWDRPKKDKDDEQRDEGDAGDAAAVASHAADRSPMASVAAHGAGR